MESKDIKNKRQNNCLEQLKEVGNNPSSLQGYGKKPLVFLLQHPLQQGGSYFFYEKYRKYLNFSCDAPKNRNVLLFLNWTHFFKIFEKLNVFNGKHV